MELLTVTVLVGILAVLGGRLILAPIQSFTDVSRRAGLVDIADNALQRMSRELRNAVPNSIRINPAGDALEFLNASAGGRYRARRDVPADQVLENCDNDTFDVPGGVSGAITPGLPGQASCLNGTADCLVIYNTGTGAGDFNAYDSDNIAAITAATGNTITCDNGAGWSFPFPIPPSSQQRFYVVDTPVSYVCSGGNLWRYQDYPIDDVQQSPIGGAPIGGVAGQLLANNVALCVFSYIGGSSSRHGLVSLQVQIQDAATAESVSLLYQVHVVNTP